jgi:hypothetical protein
VGVDVGKILSVIGRTFGGMSILRMEERNLTG